MNHARFTRGIPKISSIVNSSTRPRCMPTTCDAGVATRTSNALVLVNDLLPPVLDLPTVTDIHLESVNEEATSAQRQRGLPSILALARHVGKCAQFGQPSSGANADPTGSSGINNIWLSRR
jgi:hypothetical protein